METYLSYYYEMCLGSNSKNYFTSAKISNQNCGTVKEEYSQWVESYYFTRDCNDFSLLKKDGFSEYSEKVGRGLFGVYQKCRSNKFDMTDRKYNIAKKKFDATLYWSAQDLSGRNCILVKEFYFGPTGYEPVDDEETVYADDGADPELIQRMREAFD